MATIAQFRSMSPEERLRFWQEHVTNAEAFSGSLEEYCKAQGLSLYTFMAWRTRVRKLLVKANANAFTQVKIDKGSNISNDVLPDPQWLALFLKAWTRGVSQ